MSFDARLAEFVVRVQEMIASDYRQHYPNLGIPQVGVSTGGRRYAHLFTSGRQTMCYCFVDRTNGDVLKAESWRKPAKHKRSNIYDADFGMSGVTVHGARYL